MKSLFNILTACVNVNTAVVKSLTDVMKTEGVVIPALIKDIREGLVDSGLADAMKANLSANEEAGVAPKWFSEAKAEVKALKKAAKDLLKEDLRPKQESFNQVANKVLGMQ